MMGLASNCRDERLCRDADAQFDWSIWNGNPATTPQWLAAHRRRTTPLLAIHSQDRLTAVLERKLPGLYGPVGRHHGEFTPQPGVRPSEFFASLLPVVSRACVCLPHSHHSLLTESRRAAGRYVVARAHERVLMVTAGDPDEYTKTRPRKLRATIRNAARAAEARGLTVRTLEIGELQSVLDALVDVEKVGRRSRGHPLATPRVAAALALLDADGRLVVHVLQDSAGLHGYVIAGRGATQDYLYTTAIRAELADASPGSLLFATAIRGALAQGRTVNMGPGDTSFKRRFSTSGEAQADVLVLPEWASFSTRSVARTMCRISGTEWS